MKDRRDFESSVREHYAAWSGTFHEDYYGEDAPYPPVHRDLVKCLVRESGARSLVDAGCGPASFLRELVDADLELSGFDLAPEMVEEGRGILGDRADLWQGSVLDADSFRGTYDAAVCIGVLPHVPADSDTRILANLHDAVRPGGLAVVDARNRLLALFTLNRRTYELFRDELVGSEHEAELEPLKELLRMDQPPEGETGHEAVLSRAHNPFVLAAQMEAAGFDQVRPLFYRFNALPPQFEPSIDASLAREDPTDWRGYVMASSFLLAGKRPPAPG